MKKILYTTFATAMIVSAAIQTPVFALEGDYAPSSASSQSLCTVFSGDIAFGSSGDNVTKLQDYLSVTGYFNTESTGYFGNVTLNAVKNYQTAHNFVSTGYVGPLTRGAIQSESCGTASGASSGSTGASLGSVTCPAGYNCTATTQTPVACPLGYVCTPQTTTSGVVGATYVQGSFYRTYLSGSGSSRTITNATGTTVTNGTTSAAANSSSTILTTPSSQVVTIPVVSSLGVDDGVPNPFAGMNLSTDVNKIYAVVGADYVVPAIGKAIIPKCKDNQFWYDKTHGCVNNFITPLPMDTSVTVENTSVSTNDPYCIGKSNVDTDNNIRTLTEYWKCVMGEANSVTNYKNPWISKSNLIGVKTFGLANNLSSNFCKNAVSLSVAKQLSATNAASGIQDDYMNNSRILLVNDGVSLSWLQAQMFYMVNNHSGNNWDGSKRYEPYINSDGLEDSKFYTPNTNDWSNPQFQALLKNFQMPAVGGIAKCLDADYKSNFWGTPWASHYQRYLIDLKQQGLLR
ncbi:MAG: peptidoglycan-binding domain-containing protein [Candidatus Taylorbacteria bacterium]